MLRSNPAMTSGEAAVHRGQVTSAPPGRTHTHTHTPY